MEVPKPRRVKNKKLVKRVVGPFCEWCGSLFRGEPHHIIPRSLNGPDIPENLITLCFEHHRAAHDGKIPRKKLFALVAEREGLLVEEVIKRVEDACGRGFDNERPY